jgi:hypothetical protein
MCVCISIHCGILWCAYDSCSSPGKNQKNGNVNIYTFQKFCILFSTRVSSSYAKFSKLGKFSRSRVARVMNVVCGGPKDICETLECDFWVFLCSEKSISFYSRFVVKINLPGFSTWHELFMGPHTYIRMYKAFAFACWYY